MRQVAKHALARVSDSVSTPQPDSAAQPSAANHTDQETTPDVVSLRRLLHTARFFAGDDVQFVSVAESASTARPGDLVVYHIGQDCPSQLIADAVARGAAGILSEQILPCPLPQCIVGDVDLALADIAADHHAHPDRKLLTIGVIGSAGKTTTALLVASLLRNDDVRTAYQTDLGDSDGIVQSASSESVPSSSRLIQWLGEACLGGCEAAVVELSDDEARHGHYDAIQFDLLIVTGATPPRDDFGPTGLQCAIERMTSSGVVIAPADNTKVVRIVRDSGVKMITYGIRKPADLTAKIIDQSGGMTTLMVTHENTTAVMESSLCGAAMAANHAAAAVVGVLLGKPLHVTVEVLSRLRVIPGRGQRLDRFGHASVVVDAGGSPDRAATSLRTFRSMKCGGRLWCILAIDASDTADELARYGNVLERFADTSVITSERASKASFLSASHNVLDGVEKCAAMRMVADRDRALHWVLSRARPTDTVLMIGGIGGQSPAARRGEIESVAKFVETHRQLAEDQESSTADPREVPALKIAQF